MYGRRDLGLGSLTNLTDGGEGTTGYIKSKDWCEKHSAHLKVKYSGEGNPFYGKSHSDETKKYISEIQKQYIEYHNGSWDNVTKKKYNDSYNNKRARKVININTGIVFNSLREAGEYYSIKYPTIKNRLLGERMYRGDLWYLDIYESTLPVVSKIISFLEKGEQKVA